jgi:O-Antigen ligase
MAVTGRSSTGLLSPVAFAAGLTLVLLSPLIRGGNRHVALVALEWLGLCVLMLWARRLCSAQEAPASPLACVSGLTRLEWGLLFSPIWLGVWQLLPWPVGMWAHLPGHGVYAGVEPFAGHEPATWLSLSLLPTQTVGSLLAAVPVMAAFLLGRCANSGQLRWLTRALLSMGLFLAVMGLMQQAHFGEFLFFQAEFAGSAIGTFANHNHYANYFVMLTPLALLGLRNSLSPSRSSSSRDVLVVASWGCVLLLFVAALLASGSRAGVASALLSTCVAAGMLWYKPGILKRKPWMVLAAVVTLVAVFWLVLDPRFVTDRVSAQQLGSDTKLRWQLIVSTGAAAWAFFPFGSGLGTFEAVYPRFQPPGAGGTVPHAHSDYLELLMELGALFFVLAYLLCRLVWQQWKSWRLWTAQHRRSPEVNLQVMALIGLVGLFAHSWVEFNLRIPGQCHAGGLAAGLVVAAVAIGRGTRA